MWRLRPPWRPVRAIQARLRPKTPWPASWTRISPWSRCWTSRTKIWCVMRMFPRIRAGNHPNALSGAQFWSRHSWLGEVDRFELVKAVRRCRSRRTGARVDENEVGSIVRLLESAEARMCEGDFDAAFAALLRCVARSVPPLLARSGTLAFRISPAPQTRTVAHRARCTARPPSPSPTTAPRSAPWPAAGTPSWRQLSRARGHGQCHPVPPSAGSRWCPRCFAPLCGPSRTTPHCAVASTSYSAS